MGFGFLLRSAHEHDPAVGFLAAGTYNPANPVWPSRLAANLEGAPATCDGRHLPGKLPKVGPFCDNSPNQAEFLIALGDGHFIESSF